MAWFEAGNHSEALVPADHKEVWAAQGGEVLLPGCWERTCSG